MSDITKTIEEYVEAEEMMIGWCLDCGSEFECLEPDGEATCQECGGRVEGNGNWLALGRIV